MLKEIKTFIEKIVAEVPHLAEEATGILGKIGHYLNIAETVVDIVPAPEAPRSEDDHCQATSDGLMCQLSFDHPHDNGHVFR